MSRGFSARFWLTWFSISTIVAFVISFLWILLILYLYPDAGRTPLETPFLVTVLALFVSTYYIIYRVMRARMHLQSVNRETT